MTNNHVETEEERIDLRNLNELLNGNFQGTYLNLEHAGIVRQLKYTWELVLNRLEQNRTIKVIKLGYHYSENSEKGSYIKDIERVLCENDTIESLYLLYVPIDFEQWRDHFIDCSKYDLRPNGLTIYLLGDKLSIEHPVEASDNVKFKSIPASAL